MTLLNIANEMRGNFELHLRLVDGGDFRIASRHRWDLMNPVILFKGSVVEEDRLKPKCTYKFVFGHCTPQNNTVFIAPLPVLKLIGRIDIVPILYPVFEEVNGVKERPQQAIEFHFTPDEVILIETLVGVPLLGIQVIE